MDYVAGNIDLIGKRFKRIKYGSSNWTLTITDVLFDISSNGKILKGYVLANGVYPNTRYYFDEIKIIID